MAAYSSATITNDTHVHAARMFISSLDNKDDPIFGFASKADPWTTIEDLKEIPPKVSSGQAHSIDAINRMIFAKPLSSLDAHISLKRNDWKPNKKYAQWSIKENRIYDLPYVTVVDPTSGECNVYMCIFNNYGSPSTQQPPKTKSFELLHTSDGYRWRWMFDISKELMNKWSCDHFVPMPEQNELSSYFTREKSKFINIQYNAHLEGIDVINGGLFKSRVNLKKIKETDDVNFLDPYDIFEYEVENNPNLRLNIYAKHLIDPETGYPVVSKIIERKIDYIEVDPETEEETIHYIQESVQIGYKDKLDEYGNPELDSEGNVIQVPNIVSNDKWFDVPIYHYTISKIDVVSGGENFTDVNIRFKSKNSSDNYHFEQIEDPIIDIIINPYFVLGREPAGDVGARFVTVKLCFRDDENGMFPVSCHYRQFGLVKNLRYKTITKEMISDYMSKYNKQIPDDEIVNYIKIKEPISCFDIVKLDGVNPDKKFEVQNWFHSTVTGLTGYVIYASDVVDSHQTIYINNIETNKISNERVLSNREVVEIYDYDNKKRKVGTAAAGYVVEHIPHNFSNVYGTILYIENASNITRISRQTESFLLTFEL